MFFEAMAKDEALRARFEAIRSKHTDQKPDEAERDAIWQNEILPLASSEGFEVTLEDLKEVQAAHSSQNGKLSDDELDAVVGGGGNCTCIVGGGGGMDDGLLPCACLLGGMGFRTNGRLRCYCGNWGTGDD